MDINESDKDAIVRTVMGEAGNESPTGKAAVAHVILNRLNTGDYGSSPYKIVHAPGQFEPWATRTKELNSYNSKSKDYQATKSIVDDVLAGKIDDPTGGATHFLAPDVMKSRGTPNPDWATGQPVAQIGGHTFYAPNGAAMPDLLGSLVRSYDKPAASAAPAQEDLLGKLVKSYGPEAKKIQLTLPDTNKTGTASTDYSYMSPEGGTAALAGFGHGVMEGVNTGAQGIGYLTNKVTKFLADRGVMSPQDATTAQNRSDVLNQRIAAENATYAKNYGNSIPAQVGQVAGNMAVTAPLLMTGEGLVGAGVNALTRASPAAARVAYGLGNSTLARLGLVAPAEGALGGAEIAGGTSSGSNESVGEQMLHGAKVGAEFGPLGQVVQRVGSYLGGAAKSLVQPFTEKGREALANRFVQGRSGNALLDTREIVPGSKPTLAEATGDSNIATVQRAMYDLNPKPFDALREANNEARATHLDRVRGTPQDVEAAEAHLESQASNDRSAIFKPGQKVDTAPIVGEIDGILSGSGGKRTAVQGALTKLRGKFFNKDGSLVEDQATVYDSARKEIGDMLTGKSDNPADKAASRELLQVRDTLDNRMEHAVPGFGSYIHDYHEAAKPIEAMRYLQDLKLTDQQGNMTLAKVKGALEKIDQQRRAGGVNAAKSLSDEQIQTLRDVHDDLLRQTNLSKGKSIGSNTVQNVATQSLLGGVLGNRLGALAGNVNPTAVGTTLGGAIGSLGGPWGVPAGAVTGGAVGHMFGEAAGNKNKLVQSQIEDILLNPHRYTPQRGQNLPINRLRWLPTAAVAGSNALAAPTQ